MDFSEMVKLFFTVSVFAGGWFMRILYTATNELKKEVSALREDLPKNYVHKDDFREHRQEAMAYLQRIEGKLEAMAKELFQK